MTDDKRAADSIGTAARLFGDKKHLIRSVLLISQDHLQS